MPEELSSHDRGRLTLRHAAADDEAFLREVYASTRANELAQIPWDEAQRAAFITHQFAAQQQHYQSYFPEAVHQVILFDGLPMGRIYVDRRDQEIHILDIALLPEHRGRGIGVSILKPMMEEAALARKSLTIYVESFNPSRQFFERLGFRQKEEDGFNLLLEWRKDFSQQYD